MRSRAMNFINPLWRLEWRTRPNILSWGRVHTRIFTSQAAAIQFGINKQAHYAARGIEIEWDVYQVGR